MCPQSLFEENCRLERNYVVFGVTGAGVVDESELAELVACAVTVVVVAVDVTVDVVVLGASVVGACVTVVAAVVTGGFVTVVVVRVVVR